ncbi:hypothetical protein FDECE_11163 [Fusarium decemcellulare]|nr:hypothetical protein FDECE_11163 [Fusarium decemcellulare]
MDLRTGLPVTAANEKFEAFIQEHPRIRFIHLQWIDYTSTVRVRVLTLRHLRELLNSGKNLALCRHYLSLIDIALPFTDRDPGRPAGQCYLIPDFHSIRLYPGYDEQATIFCYFGNDAQLPRGLNDGSFSLVGPMCPRRALSQALQDLEKIGLNCLAGFELEFGCRQKFIEQDRIGEHQVHQSSGLRALESFMLPVFCTVTDALENIGIPIQQFHCEGSEDAYELVTGPMSPLDAVDAMTTSKETARRVCNSHDIQLTFNPSPPAINGLHLTISISNPDGVVGTLEDHFLAGMLEHMGALCGFGLVRPESYDRTVPVDPAMISADERHKYGIATELPSSPDEAYQVLMQDSLMLEHFGEPLLTTYVAVQKAYNKQLEDVGRKGSEARRDWLTARI